MLTPHERVAAEFHAAKERNAVDLGYEEDAATDWADVSLRDRALLVAVVNDLIRQQVIALGPMAWDELRQARGISVDEHADEAIAVTREQP